MRIRTIVLGLGAAALIVCAAEERSYKDWTEYLGGADSAQFSALKQINSSAFGLQAGLFTRDAKLIFQAYDELEVGGLIAGDVPTFRIDNMPYGGIKDSGLGREGLRDAIHEMTEPKLLVMNLR